MAFPLYVTFVASTLTLDQILTVPMPLIPGDQLFNNYCRFHRRLHEIGPGAAVSTMLTNSLIMALAIAIGKITISIIASFAIVYFRFPTQFLLLDDLRHADAAGRVSSRRSRSWPTRHAIPTRG